MNLSPFSIDDALDRFRKIRPELEFFLKKGLTESDTRVKIIDRILVEVLNWPEHQISREETVHEDGTYVDYILFTSQAFFVIEAKKEGIEFEFPLGSRRLFRIDGAIKKSNALNGAITQARSYAINKGVNFCAVTNGFQWAAFRPTNQVGVSWGKHFVLVFRDFNEIERRFTEFYEAFSHESARENITSLRIAIEQHHGNEKSNYELLNDIRLIGGKTINRNILFPFTRELISKVFQSLDNSNASSELIEHCYVESGRESGYERGIGEMLRDHASKLPFKTKNIRVQRRDAGCFEETIGNTAIAGSAEVCLLLGTVGAGKTSFLNRFRLVIGKGLIDQHFLWTYISFNEFSSSKDNIFNYISSKIKSAIEDAFPDENPFRWEILQEIYRKDIRDLKEGRLNPLFRRDAAAFEERIADEIRPLMESNDHYFRALGYLATRNKKRVLIVFDNADQHPADIQNELFQLAKQISDQLSCCVFLSLREESFWSNKEFGVLSSFHATAFQITAPRIEQVLAKRFKFARLVISGQSDIAIRQSTLRDIGIDSEKALKIFQHIHETILGNDKSYIKFLEYLNPGEVRRSLDFVARFLSSGHTNINAIIDRIDSNAPPIGFHEFLTSIALGDREIYQESYSDVVNLFAVHGRNDEGHFNRLAILARIINRPSGRSDFEGNFVTLNTLVSDCEALGISPETTTYCLGALIRKRLIATDTLSRESFGDDSGLRATSAAIYYIEELAFNFTYLELILFDTRIRIGRHLDELNVFTRSIRDEDDRYNKILLRLRRVEAFVDYLHTQFENCTLSRYPDGFDRAVIDLIPRIKEQLPGILSKVRERARTALGRN